ncbi:lasso RiPP family leader peptide-containing protein [Actinokineospora guangxiensis]|uniref:Lasso RiPP family leader peptide-containing protein n=1 Tax=Actinokineospora guangxiensis TaxID=1490288 RepID=A0ABW0EMU0_9PSEU
MSDDHAIPAVEAEYEPPTVVDLGAVHAVTNGNSDGSGDPTAQEAGR